MHLALVTMGTLCSVVHPIYTKSCQKLASLPRSCLEHEPFWGDGLGVLASQLYTLTSREIGSPQSENGFVSNNI